MVFCDTPLTSSMRWWRWITRPGFRHCWVVRELGPTVALVLNMQDRQLEVDAYVVEGHSRPIGPLLANPAVRVLRMDVPAGAGRFYPRGILTCVSIVKAVFALRCWWVVTPYGLWRWLLKHGATEVQAYGRT